MMHPFFHLFGIQIPAYGLCLTAAVFLCCFFAIKSAGRRGISVEDMLILSAVSVGSGLLCAAGLYLAVTYTPKQLAEFLRNGDFSFLQTVGLVFYGGIIGGAVGGLITMRVMKQNPKVLLPCIVPFLPMAHAIGRVGCLLAGCCHGMPYSGPLAVKNLAISPDATFFPIQLMESLYNLVIMGLLLVLSKKQQAQQYLLELYLMLYALLRFTAEFFRADAARGIFWNLSTSQWISIGLLLICAGSLLHKFRSTSKSA